MSCTAIPTWSSSRSLQNAGAMFRASRLRTMAPVIRSRRISPARSGISTCSSRRAEPAGPTSGSQATVTRIENQLQRLVDVISVDDLTNVESLHREMVLVRLNRTAQNTEAVKDAIDANKWKVILSGDTFVIIEITGDKTQIDFALARLEPFGMADITRTGLVALKLED